MNTGTNVALIRRTAALGAAECATTQTVHLLDSAALEWRCAARANADESVSTKHNNATDFKIERTSVALQTVD